MDSWVTRLCLLGFQGSQQRQQTLLNVLEANSADALDFLVFETPLCGWHEITTLTAAEIKFLENVSNFEKKLSATVSQLTYLGVPLQYVRVFCFLQFQNECSGIRGELDDGAQIVLLPSG